MINFVNINTFEGGNSKDLSDNIEKKNTFSLGKNGRIYSNNGTMAYGSIEGTKLVYQNLDIIKWLGSHSFSDQAIVFAKCKRPSQEGAGTERQVCQQIVFSEGTSITSDVDSGYVISIGNEISANSNVIESCYTVTEPEADPTDFEVPYSEVTEEATQVDFKEYYEERVNVADFKLCDTNLNQIPVHNELYYDTIISFTIDDQGILKGERIWTGAQNWPLEGKITAEGVEENEFYKRIYYTDAVNPRRVMNIKDQSLSTRNPSEFSQILDNVLLQPEIKAILDGGQLPAMRVMYVYRKISQQGQVSEFSPFSFFADIVPESEGSKFRGGDISEATGKRVSVQVNLIDPEPSSEVEMIALEFEAQGPPTALRNLGIKKAAPVVVFDHFGNEATLIDDVTIHDILEFKNTWKYCNDFTSKKNKLIAGGLRNNPVPSQIQNLEYLFPLHGWDRLGKTFESLMNPRPWEYRYIDPLSTSKLIYVKQKKYESIASFGPMTLSLTNKVLGASIRKTFSDLTLEAYSTVTDQVLEWLLQEQQENPAFANYFHNLRIEDHDGQILFTPIDESFKTDLSNYIFESNNEQFIETFRNDIVFMEAVVNTSRLVHGAQSIGFNQGNGIRITYKEFKEPLLRQANKVYDGTGKLLDLEKPSGETYFMKGELYRLAFQTFDSSSSRYFSIPLGDVMIPELGDMVTSIDSQGNPVITSRKYVNQSVENGILYGHGIKMHIEVRLDCEMQKLISMYQIVYVERTEDNRTILCQGIAAPLQRVQTNMHDHNEMPQELNNKWTLPYYGGPAYERRGLDSYDKHGENYEYKKDDFWDRVMTHRRLMYFDSPDLYLGRISDQYVKSSKLQVIAKLNTDHTPGAMMERGDGYYHNYRREKYPKFSRKILEDQIDGQSNVEGLPRIAYEKGSKSYETYFINVSVFANYLNYKKEFGISKAVSMNRGEVIAGMALGVDHDVSNNAIALPCMPWFFGDYARKWERDGSGDPKVALFKTAVPSPGYRTVILKTDADLFTDIFIGPDVHDVDSQIRMGGHHTIYDTYPLINLYRNNRESVFGGRTEQAYSRNTFIPLSRTIPVSKSTGAQAFDVGGDVYVTLNIRTKNDAGDAELKEVNFNHGGNSSNDKGDINTWQRHGAWNYVSVIESQVEPKLTYDHEFWRESTRHNFDIVKNEIINGAYFNTPQLKQYIPKPFKFRDDPNLGNIVAVSNVKLAGENFDSWTMFQPNNYYPMLEKNKGDVSNLLMFKDQVYAIQGMQTSLLHIGTDRIINDQNGTPINIKQGSGEVVEGHQVISSYGTSIRRAVAVSDFGFSFFDEKHVEFVKMDQPLLVAAVMHLDYWNLVKNDRIVDSEAYFDHKNKETNIRVRTASGKSFCLSYNELMGVFNGEHEHNADHYMEFDKKVYAPIGGSLMHELNAGDPLHLFGSQKLLRVGITLNASIEKVFQLRQLGLITNLKYPVSNVIFKTSLGQDRIVMGNHPGYKIREGNHTLPPKNETDDYEDLGDLRGNWITAEITAESKQKNKVDILAVVSSLRISHQ